MPEQTLHKRPARPFFRCLAGLLVALVSCHAHVCVGGLVPGDQIRLQMVEDVDVMFSGAVSAAGTVPIPYVGEFAVGGLSCDEVETQLAALLQRDLYQKATVRATLIRKAPGHVYVYGAVKKPGVVTMPEVGSLTMLQLISQVEGLTSWADAPSAYIMRTENGQKRRVPVDLVAIFGAQGGGGDVSMQADDVLFVPGVNGDVQQVMSADSCEVIVVGEVGRSGIVQFAPGEQRTLMRAVFKAGGLSKFAKGKAIKLIRYSPNGDRTVTIVNAEAVIEDGFLDRDVELLPGDMLIVPQKMINF